MSHWRDQQTMSARFDELPDFALDRLGPLVRQLGNVGNFHDAARRIADLPYGRNSRPIDYRLVPIEQRGTCTTKHAFLAALSHEQGCPLQLLVCFFDMSGQTHPAVAETLARAGLASIREAHCLIGFEGKIFDLTGLPPSDPLPEYSDFARLPLDQLDQKQALHRGALAIWAEQKRISMPVQRLWSIREQCIRDLAGDKRQEERS